MVHVNRTRVVPSISSNCATRPARSGRNVRVAKLNHVQLRKGIQSQFVSVILRLKLILATSSSKVIYINMRRRGEGIEKRNREPQNLTKNK